ncbi:MAG: GAF domain-containing protein, partial [Chloroflexi bacterium]
MTKRGKATAQSGQPVEPVSRHFIHWDTVTRCSQASTTTLELSPLCRQVTDIIQENYRLCRVALYLRQGKSSAFSLQAVSPPAPGLDKDTVLSADSFPGLTNLLKERASFFASLSGTDSPASLLVEPAARLRLALPLATPNDILGILDLQAAEASDLTAEDLPYFEALADHITALIEHARQYEQITTERNRANLLYEVSAALKADLDFEAVADTAVGLADKLGATTGEIHLLDERGNIFYRSSYAERNKISPEVWTRLVRRTLTEGLDAWVIRNRKPALVHDTLTDKRWLKVGHQDDMPGARSAICAPIIVERRGIRGAISFVHPEPNRFNEQDISMLQALASQIGIALENSSLLTEYSKNLDDARLLLETSQQLAKTHTLNEVYTALLNGLLKTGLDRTTFHLCHDLDPADVPQTAELVVVSSKENGTVWAENPERYPLRDMPAVYQMAADQEPLVVTNIHTDERLSELETRFWREAGIHSVTVLPLVIRTHTFGFVTLESRTARTFTEHDLNLYQTICHQAVSAIQNARQIEFTTEALTSSQALYRAGRILANTVNPQKALEDALMEFIYSLGVDQGAIINLSPEGDYGYPIAYIENYEFQPVKGLKFPINRNSKYLQTLLSGQPVTCADLQNDPDFADFVPFNPDRPPQSLLSAPILLKGEIIGWIGADAVHEKRYFTQQEVDLARAMADQIAIAIQNHRLIEETRRRAEQFRAVAEVGEAVAGLIDLNEVLTKTVNLIRDRFGFYHVSIFLLDDKQEWAVVRASTGEVGKIMVERPHRLKVGGQSIVGFVTGNAQPRIALDVGQDAVHFDNPLLPNTRSEMALPLIYRGTVIGALDVQSTEANAFTDEDVETLQIMADQLASAISNARLFEQLQTGLMEQGILYNIGTRVSATLDLRTAATVLTQETAEALKVAQCTLSLLEENGQVRVVSDYVQTNRPLRSFQGERIPLASAPLYRQVLDTQEEVVVHLADLPETETGPEIDYLRQNQGTLLVIVPILLRKKVIGFLEIYDDTPKRRIQPANLTLLDGIALLAANTIHNANLYERTQANLERTRLLYTLSDTLATARKLNETLQIVLGEFLKLLKVKQGGILLFDKARENGIMRALVVNGKQAEAGQVFPVAEDPIARYIIQHPEPLVIDDVRTHPLTKDTPHLRPANTRGMLL